METTNQIKMTTALAILFAICSGLAIGNMYWAQPLLVQIMTSFGLPELREGYLLLQHKLGMH